MFLLSFENLETHVIGFGSFRPICQVKQRWGNTCRIEAESQNQGIVRYTPGLEKSLARREWSDLVSENQAIQPGLALPSGPLGPG